MHGSKEGEGMDVPAELVEGILAERLARLVIENAKLEAYARTLEKELTDKDREGGE